MKKVNKWAETTAPPPVLNVFCNKISSNLQSTVKQEPFAVSQINFTIRVQTSTGIQAAAISNNGTTWISLPQEGIDKIVNKSPPPGTKKYTE